MSTQLDRIEAMLRLLLELNGIKDIEDSIEADLLSIRYAESKAAMRRTQRPPVRPVMTNAIAGPQTGRGVR